MTVSSLLHNWGHWAQSWRRTALALVATRRPTDRQEEREEGGQRSTETTGWPWAEEEANERKWGQPSKGVAGTGC